MRRILHLIDTRGPGGAETIFLSLLANLSETRWESTPVLTGPGWLEEQVKGLGLSPVLLAPSDPFYLGNVARLRSLIKKQKIDLIQTHLQGSALIGTLAGGLTGTPVVATFHGTPDFQLSGLRGSVKKSLLTWAPMQSVFVSNSLRTWALNRGLVRAERAHVILNGIDTDLYRPRDIETPAVPESKGRFLVGSIGNLRTPKDYPNLLRAASRVTSKRPGTFRFVVYGQRSDPPLSELLHLRTHLGLDEDDFSFEGFRYDIPDLLPGLDALAISSSSEGFSLVAIQAMACGVPVVSTRCGGPEEIIRDGVDGLLVPKEDPNALADAILGLFEDSAVRGRLVSEGRETALERFSLDSMVAAYEQLYDRYPKRAQARV